MIGCVALLLLLVRHRCVPLLPSSLPMPAIAGEFRLLKLSHCGLLPPLSCTNFMFCCFARYASVGTMELLGTDGPAGVGETRPCVLCEYSHAMGNSNGNLHKYWEVG